MRDTEMRGSDRVDQRLALVGALSNVEFAICCTCSSVSVNGRPGRGSSTKPSNRRSANRSRHSVTVGRDKRSPGLQTDALIIRQVDYDSSRNRPEPTLPAPQTI
jgi:hypothetical protein